jgi:hypothetical protein
VVYFIYILFILILVFGFVILFGAPYLPTLKKQINPAFDLLNLKEGQTLIELGSGDGRILSEAAKRGINVIGYELNPLLVIYSKIITWKYRSKVKIKWGNFWNTEWPETDAIFVFLLSRYMLKLDKKVTQSYSTPVKLVSFAFKIPGKEISLQKNGLFLYKYNNPLK